MEENFMKRIAKLLFIGLFSLSVFVLAGCQSENITISNPTFESSEEVYAFSALSATSLLHQEVSSVTYGNLSYQDTSLKFSTLADEETLAVEDEMDELNKYLNIMEKFLGNNNGLGVSVVASDTVDYETKMVFVTRNLLSEEVTYEVYYNETTLVDEDEDLEDEADEEEEEEEEIETQLEGMMIVDGVQYTLVGTREYEDGEEEITMKAYLDDNNYVKVKYELEEEERKFKFEVKIDGVVTSRTEVQVEEEDDETKIELEFIEGNAEGYYEFKLETEDGVQQIKIEYEVTDEFGNTEEGEIKVCVIVDEITGETTYEYEVKSDDDDEVRKYEKDRDEDDDDDDDEDEIEEEDEEEDEEEVVDGE